MPNNLDDQPDVASRGGDPNGGGVGEQQQGKCDLGESVHRAALDVDA